MKKVGRNELCPCGSGKKYKKCCLQMEEGERTFYRRVIQSYNSILEKHAEFVVSDLDEKVLSEGMKDFFLGYEEDQNKEELLEEFGNLFWPWLFFNWTSDTDTLAASGLDSIISPETTLAELYLQRKGNNLDKWEQAIFSELNRKPSTFLEIKQVARENGFQVLDLFTGSEFFITDLELSRWLEEQDIILANSCQIEARNVLTGCSEIKIPLPYKSKIEEYRTELLNSYHEITEEVLRENLTDIRNIYLDIYFTIFREPSMTDTEEDEPSFRTVYYDIQSPENAFEQLYSLCEHSTREELLERAEFDADGHLQEVEIPWIQGGEDLEESEAFIQDGVLGSIYILGKSLIVEVSTEDREEEIRKEIESRLGSEASYRI